MSLSTPKYDSKLNVFGTLGLKIRESSFSKINKIILIEGFCNNTKSTPPKFPHNF
jgi:hypothetical protein